MQSPSTPPFSKETEPKTQSRSAKIQKLDLYSLPLVLLFGGFLTDLLHHLTSGEGLNDFMFGTEGIFSPQRILLPTVVAVLLILVIIKSLSRFE